MRAIFDDYTMLPDTDGPPPLATVATGAAGIAALLPDWRDLAAWGAGGGAPASLLTWLARNRQPSAVRLVAIRSGERLVGLWPLRLRRIGPARIAERLGGPLQPYDDLLVAADVDPQPVARAAWSALVDPAQADAVHLPSLPTTSPLALLPAVAGHARTLGEASILDLRRFADTAAYLSSRSKNRRQALRQRRRQMAAQGPIRFRCIEAPAHRHQLLEQALAWKQEWLAGRGYLGFGLSDPDLRSALLSAVADPALVSDLPVFTLEIGDQLAAVELGQRAGNHYLSWLGAYAPVLAPLGPGAALTVEVVGWCIQQGLTTYDLLPPRTDFKEDWADSHPAVLSATIPLTATGRLALPALQHGRRLAKIAFDRLPPGARTMLHHLLRRGRG